MILQQTPGVCVFITCEFEETHLTINDSPGTRDFVVAADPIVDGLR